MTPSAHLISNKYLYPAIAALILLGSAFTFIATNWQIADGYTIEFSSNDASGSSKHLRGPPL